MTSIFNRARSAALIALALGIVAGGVIPAQAFSLKQLPETGSNDHRDCDSRREVKNYLQAYGLRHVEVSKTRDAYVYRVTGYAPPPREEVELSGLNALPSSGMSSSKSDYVRYVILFDGCDHSKTKILQPAP